MDEFRDDRRFSGTYLPLNDELSRWDSRGRQKPIKLSEHKFPTYKRTRSFGDVGAKRANRIAKPFRNSLLGQPCLGLGHDFFRLDLECLGYPDDGTEADGFACFD